MFFCVLIEFHPMVGLDLHAEPPPPPAPPTPIPMQPHLTTALLNWVIPASTANTVRATWAHARIMQRMTDIQSLIPHIPLTPNCMLAPMYTVFSGSKSYWGPSSVMANGSPIAVAEAIIVNHNLNCGDIPMGTGIVIAPNTVVAGMTWGDFFGGLFNMWAEAAVQALLNKLLPTTWGGGIAGLFLGSPLGFSFNGGGTGPVGIAGRFGGMLGSFLRSLGEDLGGDHEQAAADRHKLWESIKNEATHPGPWNWNIFGSSGDGKQDHGPLGIGRTDGDGDARKLGGGVPILSGGPGGAVSGGIVGAAKDAWNAPPRITPGVTSPALDNPGAEQF